MSPQKIPFLAIVLTLVGGGIAIAAFVHAQTGTTMTNTAASSSSSVSSASSVPTSAGSSTTAPSPPSAPTNITRSDTERGNGFQRLPLFWTDTSNDEDRFVIYRRLIWPTWRPEVEWKKLGQVASNVTSYTDMEAIFNSVFEYRVDACNSVGCTPNSVSFVTPVCNPETFLTYLLQSMECSTPGWIPTRIPDWTVKECTLIVCVAPVGQSSSSVARAVTASSSSSIALSVTSATSSGGLSSPTVPAVTSVPSVVPSVLRLAAPLNAPKVQTGSTVRQKVSKVKVRVLKKQQQALRKTLRTLERSLLRKKNVAALSQIADLRDELSDLDLRDPSATETLKSLQEEIAELRLVVTKKAKPSHSGS